VWKAAGDASSSSLYEDWSRKAKSAPDHKELTSCQMGASIDCIFEIPLDMDVSP
jgi:hypothetical protein